MEEEFFSRIHHVAAGPAADFLTEPVSQRYFVPFLARETTAAVVARDLGVDTGSVLYRIRRMLDLGLLVQTREVPRAGRAVRHYRAVADAVFVPLALTTNASLAELFSGGRSDTATRVRADLHRAWLQLGDEQGWGAHLYRGPGGVVNRDFLPRDLLGGEEFWRRVLTDRAPAVWDQYAELHLTRRRAKALQRELAEVVRRYAEPGDEEDPGPTGRHLVHLALAPER